MKLKIGIQINVESAPKSKSRHPNQSNPNPLDRRPNQPRITTQIKLKIIINLESAPKLNQPKVSVKIKINLIQIP